MKKRLIYHRRTDGEERTDEEKSESGDLSAKEKSEERSSSGKEKWHHKKWVRIVALCVAVSLAGSELILRLIPETPAASWDALSPEVLVAPEIQELLKDPQGLSEAIRKARKKQQQEESEQAEAASEAAALQEKLQNAASEAQKAIDAGEYEKAIPLVDELIDALEGGDEEEVLQLKMTRAALYFSCGRYEEASAACTEFIDQGRDEEGYYYFLRSVCALQAQEYQAARDDLLAAIGHGYEDQAICYVHLAFCENYLENYSLVLDYAKRAEELGAGSEYRDTLVYLQAVASLKLEKFDDSIRYIDELLSTEGYAENGELYYYRGVCYLTKEEYQKAYDDFTQAMAYGEETTMLYYNKGVAALGLDKTDEAKEYLEKVVDRNDEPDLTSAAQEILDMYQQQ